MISADEVRLFIAIDFLSEKINRNDIKQFQKEITVLSAKLDFPMKKDFHYNNRGCIYIGLKNYTNAINDFTSTFFNQITNPSLILIMVCILLLILLNQK